MKIFWLLGVWIALLIVALCYAPAMNKLFPKPVEVVKVVEKQVEVVKEVLVDRRIAGIELEEVAGEVHTYKFRVTGDHFEGFNVKGCGDGTNCLLIKGDV